MDKQKENDAKMITPAFGQKQVHQNGVS